MIFSEHIKNALKLAIKAHELNQKQKRKGKDVPYIVHPLIVGMLLARVGAPEEVVAAGLLHDTIEDSSREKPVTKEQIERAFTPRIVSAVVSVTEDIKIANWEERKKESIERIKKFNLDSILVRSADVLANTTELLHDYNKDGLKVFDRFGGKAHRVVEHYMTVMTELEKRSMLLPKSQKNPFVGELKSMRTQLKKILAQLPRSS